MREGYIKRKLITKLLPPGADVYKELHLGNCIPDVIFMEDHKITGLEIKSDHDSLRRFIANQRTAYPYWFDEVWLVVSKKHVEKAKDELINGRYLGPGDTCPWGLYDTDFTVHIPAKDNHRP